MATNLRSTKTFVLPDMSDRYTNGNPPDGYTLSFSATDGYYLARLPSRAMLIATTGPTGPYNAGVEDVVLVPTHGAPFTVNLPISPTAGTAIYVKDLASGALANPITVSSAALIDGSATYVININYGAVRVMWTGSTWTILSKI